MLTLEERRRIGDIFINRRKEQNKTQSEICSILYSYGISEYAYKRVEQASTQVSLEQIIEIAAALKIDLFSLLSLNDNYRIIPFYSNAYIHNQQYRCFYPRIGDYDHAPDFHTRNLFRFLLYLPLFNPKILFDILYRIDGDFIEREDYVLDQLQRLFIGIPDCKAKRYIEYVEEGILHPVSDDPFQEQQWLLNYRNNRPSDECHEEYLNRINDIANMVKFIQKI